MQKRVSFQIREITKFWTSIVSRVDREKGIFEARCYKVKDGWKIKINVHKKEFKTEVIRINGGVNQVLKAYHVKQFTLQEGGIMVFLKELGQQTLDALGSIGVIGNFLSNSKCDIM